MNIIFCQGGLKYYIIYQILQYGTLVDFKWLKELYSLSDIRSLFSSKPRKTYAPQTFNFVKKYLLDIKEDLDPGLYIV